MISDKFHLTYLPQKKDNIQSELSDCIERLFNDLALLNIYIDRILILNLFVKNSKDMDLPDILNPMLRKYFKSDLPPYAIIMQSPAEGFNVSIEVLVAKNEELEVTTKLLRIGDKEYIYKIVESGTGMEIFASGIQFGEGTIKEQSENAFGIMDFILKTTRLSYSDICRQWNYIGGITQCDSDGQNYQVFNNVRSHFYKQSYWDEGYPSATGIGTSGGGVQISFIASWNTYSKKITIRNPRQVDAHSYSNGVLFGNETDKSTPKFERAKAIINENQIEIYISGTAAIVGEETAVVDDIESQTNITIENIKQLISIDNLKAHGINAQDISIKHFRAYIKNPKDSEIVQYICSREFRKASAIYVIADVCRPELLVEIEAYALATVVPS